MRRQTIRRARRRTLAALVLLLSLAGSCAPTPVTPTPAQRATTTPGPTDSPVPGPTLEPGTWQEVGADAFAADGPVAVLGVEHTELGDVILGSIEGRAAGWFRAADAEWSRIPLEASAQDSRLAAAAASENELVIAVFAEEGTGDAIWRLSAEGWTVVRADGAFATGSVVRDITWSGTEFVAVGQRSPNEDGTTSIEGQVAAAWTSPDGRAWQRAEVRTAARGSWLFRVETGPGGVVAGGQIAGATTDAFVLRYVRGAWELVEPPAMLTDGEEHVATIGSSGAGWDLRIEARPVDCSQVCPEQHVLRWTSPDGVDWSQAAVADGPTILFGGDETGLYGAFTGDGLTLFVSRSTDGETWVEATVDLDPPGETMVRGVTRVDGGFLAVGETADGAIVTWEWRDPPE